MLKQKNALIPLAAALLVASCGGGGDGGPSVSAAPLQPAAQGTATQATTAGKVVDGYIAGASVFCDANGNGVRDAGEEAVLSDAQGSFTFAAACASPVVAIGGTDAATGLPFQGVLKAPPGSVVVTAGTTLLVNTSLDRDRLATALGLPAGTDITAIDPAASNGGALANPAVLQRTLALQQIVQQISSALAALVPDAPAGQTQALYAETAQAAGTVIRSNGATTVVSTTGTVDPAVVSAIAQQALANVAASADARLANARAGIAAVSQANLAALVAPAIAAQAQTLATAANSNALTRATQSDTRVADAVRQTAAQLKSAAGIDLSAAGANLSQLVSAAMNEAQAALR